MSQYSAAMSVSDETNRTEDCQPDPAGRRAAPHKWAASKWRAYRGLPDYRGAIPGVTRPHRRRCRQRLQTEELLTVKSVSPWRATSAMAQTAVVMISAPAR